MNRTYITTPNFRPEASFFTSHTPAVPECRTITTVPLAARDFFVCTEHRATCTREKRCWCARVYTQIKAAIILFA